MSDDRIPEPTIDDSPKAIAEKSLERKTFRFADALKDRTLPQQEVSVYLDEAGALPLIDIQERLNRVTGKLDVLDSMSPEERKDATDRYADLEAERDAIEVERHNVTKNLNDSKYVIIVRGITPGYDEDCRTKALAEYPVEYETYTNEITGARVKEEIESPERARYLGNLLFRGHIAQITAPDGSVEVLPDLETAAAMRRELPVACRFNIEQAIERVDMAVNWYTAMADEAFLAKP